MKKISDVKKKKIEAILTDNEKLCWIAANHGMSIQDIATAIDLDELTIKHILQNIEIKVEELDKS